MKPEKAISILSGGMDSTVATALALRDMNIILALTFDYGQRAAAREITAARIFCTQHGIPHQVITLPWLKNWTNTSLVDQNQQVPSTSVSELDHNFSADLERAKKVWVPNRNGVFLSIAAAAAESLGAAYLITGFNEEEAATFPDNSQNYLEAMNHSFSFSTLNQVKLISPTIRLNKAEIAKTAKQLEIDLSQLWSCYEGGEKPCGACESCVRQQRAVLSS